MSCVVVPITDESLRSTNLVYLHPETKLDFSSCPLPLPYRLVFENESVYQVGYLSSLGLSEIALNPDQRKNTQVSVRDKISPRPDTRAMSTIPIITNLDLEVVNILGRAVLPLITRPSDLRRMILSVGENLVFHEKDTFTCDFRGSALCFSVSRMSTDVWWRSRGRIVSETRITFTAENIIFLPEEKTEKTENKLFHGEFNFQEMGIGGLGPEAATIFRRTFRSRLHSPEFVRSLGMKHIRGMLLSGPPGTGKTLIARQISRLLSGPSPLIVNGPAILNKFLGVSEENIRNLFAPAEKDYADRGERADVHVIIFDEIDSICREREETDHSLTNSVVGQLLTKMDGVSSADNVIVIGLTNRKNLLDAALLRPGRFEVQIEIGLPDQKGRTEILEIHTKSMRLSGMLADDVNISELSALSEEFTGADLEGSVKSATSFALERLGWTRDEGDGREKEKGFKITQAEFLRGLEEIRTSKKK